MMAMNAVFAAWRDLLDNKSDPRVKNWPLMKSPLPTLCICLAYAFFAKVIGPKLMKNRKPFELRKLIIVYNAIQIVISMKIFYDACTLGWLTDYSWHCQPLDRSPTGRGLQTAFACYLYYLSKFTEFFDTLFFVLRKRFDQVSTLHVIHHGIMPFSVWWGVKFSPGGHGTFFGFINTGVHIIMYTYYMLAAIGPHMQKYLWWKRYLTVIQMLQFVMVFLHSLLLFVSNDCNFPTIFTWCLVLHAVMFFILFNAFYKEVYIKKINQNSLKSSHLKEKSGESNTKAFKTTNKIEESYYTLKNRAFVHDLNDNYEKEFQEKSN